MWSAMTEESSSQQGAQPAAEAALQAEALRLHDLLAELAARLNPFPAFLGMTTIQAVELEPGIKGMPDRGCVVVLPDGQICELELRLITGAEGVSDVDQTEQFTELDLPPDEYIVYAAAAARLLYQELVMRGQ